MRHYQVCIHVLWVDPSTGQEVRWRTLFDDIGANDEQSAAAIAGAMHNWYGSVESAEAVLLPSRSTS